MDVNASVVAALMQLKGLDTGTAAQLTHVPHGSLLRWLTDSATDEEVPFDTQLELLNILGVHDDSPRNDVVHYWRIHESLFSTSSTTYAPLQTVLKAFGPAELAFVARDVDPMLCLSAKAHFALTFVNFMAVLEVTAHPLKRISLDPDTMSDLSWAPGAQGILLPELEYLSLEPGVLKVRGLHQRLTYSAEVTQWDKLRESAIEHGISAEQVAEILLGAQPAAPRIAQPPAQPASQKPSSHVHRPQGKGGYSNKPPRTAPSNSPVVAHRPPDLVKPVPQMFDEPVRGL